MQDSIKVLDVVSNTISNADAVPLRIAIENSLSENKAIKLSFSGISLLTTSFLNSSLGEVIDTCGIDVVTKSISIVDYTPSVGNFITQYVKTYNIPKQL